MDIVHFSMQTVCVFTQELVYAHGHVTWSMMHTSSTCVKYKSMSIHVLTTKRAHAYNSDLSITLLATTGSNTTAKESLLNSS